MINGAHVLLYTADAEADRAFIRDVLGFRSVDAGDGWLIFALPPTELAVHPAGQDDVGAALYLMCEDVEAVAASLAERGVEVAARQDAGWGIVTSIPLPSGGTIGLYQPRHPTAFAPDAP